MSSLNLVIVESAAKAKTIRKYLNSIPELSHIGSFDVVASLGHVRDLPLKELGVDVNNWNISYEILSKKKALVADLKQKARNCKKVFLASDLDYEGEAIAFHLRELLALKRDRYERVTFNEITKKALKDAFLSPRDIDMAQVHAQETRRILDRVVGYETSPLLWRRFATSSLSAGRVQSAALQMIVDRDREIKEHPLTNQWGISLKMTPVDIDTPFDAKAYRDQRVAVWEDGKDVVEIIHEMAGITDWRAIFSTRLVKKNPSAPFTTSTMQQEAYQRHSFSAKRTMQLAQTLYEAGHITYMRTDSTMLSEDAQKAIIKWIEGSEDLGQAFVQPRTYSTKNSHAQGAHEAIRPSKVEMRAEHLDGDPWTDAHRKLYDLIWRRAVASQMVAATYHEISFDLQSDEWDSAEIRLVGKTQLLKEPGYLKLYQPDACKTDMTCHSEWSRYLEIGKVPMKLHSIHGDGDVDRPPSLYNESTLVKALEKEGIGRPSTYATILDKLFDKGYVAKGMNPQYDIRVENYEWNSDMGELIAYESLVHIGGKETDRMVPSSLGIRVAGYLHETVPKIIDKTFTAELEKMLDHVNAGHATKIDTLDRFYKEFHPCIENAGNIIQAHPKTEKTAKTTADPSSHAPKNILCDYPDSGASVVQTKFGPAMFHHKSKSFASVLPFLAWKQKTYEELTDKDIKFLFGFPIKVPNIDGDVMMGKYGLYIKRGNKNLRLDKNEWDVIYDGFDATASSTIMQSPSPMKNAPKRIVRKKE